MCTQCKHGANRFRPGAAPAQQEAPAEGGLVVGLPRLGLDGRLHPALRRLRRHGPGPEAAHSDIVQVQVVSPVRLHPGK